MFERAGGEISNRYPYYESLERELEALVGEPLTVTAGITEALYLLGILTFARGGASRRR